MTSTHRKTQGAALLAFIFILLISLTALIFALSKSGQFAQKTTANNYRAQQAFEAAQAGLEFGFVYLSKNSATIIRDTNTDGYIDSFSNASTSNVTLANGSKYTITYTNPIQSNFRLIRIQSVGTSADGTASSTIRQQGYFSPTLVSYGTYPATIRGNITMAGNSSITNTSSNSNIQAGGSITFNGNSDTITSGGTSSSSAHQGSDVSQNVASLSSSTAASFFATYFGTSASAVQSSVSTSYQNSSNTNYDSVLNGVQGTSIWISQTGGTTATIDSNTVIGSATSPVLLIVNGNLNLAGNAIIYGFIFVTGNVQTTGNSVINGALAVGGNASDAGNYSLTFSNSILQKVQQTSGTFGKVAGSWNDFRQ